MNKKFPDEMITFLEENSAGRTSSEIVEMCNKKFKPKVPYTREQIYPLLHKFCIDYKKTCGKKPSFNSEEIQFIKDHYKEVSRPGMVKLLKEQFGKKWTLAQVSGIYFKYGLQILDRYGKIIEPDGQRIRGNYELPDETIRFSTNGRLTIKSNGKWTEFSRYMYRKFHPDEELGLNDRVIHLDGDIYNCGEKNLEKVTSAEMTVMNRMKLFSSDPEVTKTGVLIARARCVRLNKVREKEKRKKE